MAIPNEIRQKGLYEVLHYDLLYFTRERVDSMYEAAVGEDDRKEVEKLENNVSKLETGILDQLEKWLEFLESEDVKTQQFSKNPNDYRVLLDELLP